MPPDNLKKILACCSIAGLLGASVLTAGCSRQEEPPETPGDQEASQQPAGSVDDDHEKSTKPTGKEIQIRGDSG